MRKPPVILMAMLVSGACVGGAMEYQHAIDIASVEKKAADKLNEATTSCGFVASISAGNTFNYDECVGRHILDSENAQSLPE